MSTSDQVQAIKSRFASVEKSLAKNSWFKKDKWLVSVHCFPNDVKPSAVTFHVFKKHWWNEDRQGIHIESYLDLDPKKQKKTYVTIHLLHLPKIPGTNLKRDSLSKPFVDAIYDEVKAWPGYKFRAGKYGTQPFTKSLNGCSADFESDHSKEVSRMCTKLGPELEKCIKELV